jgi:excisionase family DNA binding protein
MRTATLEDIEMIVAARIADLEQRVAPEALRVADVARRLHLSQTRVRELIVSGEIRSYRIGGSRRVDPTDLAAFIAERRTAATASEAHVSSRAIGRTKPAQAAGSWLANLKREAYGE